MTRSLCMPELLRAPPAPPKEGPLPLPCISKVASKAYCSSQLNTCAGFISSSSTKRVAMCTPLEHCLGAANA